MEYEKEQSAAAKRRADLKKSAQTNKERFIKELAVSILSGERAVGEKLPTERELAAQMDMSKTVVHSGLEQLSQMGLVKVLPQSGSYVADYMKTGNAKTIEAIVRYGGRLVDYDMSVAILDLRMAIEGLAFRRLGQRRTPEDVEKLQSMTEEISKKAANGTAYSELAEMLFEWHRNVCIMSRSEMLPLFINALHDISIPFWEKYLNMMGLENAVNLLQGFTERIADGDGIGACILMNSGIDEYLKYISSEE